MSSLPANHRICPRRRADYVLNLQFKDPDGVPIDITDWQILAQIWKKTRSDKLADFDVVILDAVEGRIELTLNYQETEQLPDKAFYDVLVINSNNNRRDYYLEGDVVVSEGYTEEE